MTKTQKERVQDFRDTLGFPKSIAHQIAVAYNFTTPAQFLQEVDKYEFFDMVAVLHNDNHPETPDANYKIWCTEHQLWYDISPYYNAVKALKERKISLSQISKRHPSWLVEQYELVELFESIGTVPCRLEEKYGITSIHDLCRKMSRSDLLKVEGCTSPIVDKIIAKLTAKGFSLKPEKHDVNLYDSLPVSTFVKKTLIQKGVYTKKHFAQFYISDFLDIKGVNVYTAYLTQKKLAEYNISMNAGVEWDRFERKMDEAFCYTDGIQSDVLREIFKKALVCYMKSYKF